MKRERVFGSSFSPGRYYKLLQPVGPIPSGIYRFEGVDEDSLTFSVGRERSVIFSIAHLSYEMISEVSYSVGKRHRIRTHEFTDHYFENVDHIPLEWTEEQRDDKAPALTFCFIPIEQSLLARGPLLQKLFAAEVNSGGWHSVMPLTFDA